MNKYIKPEMVISRFESENVVTSSSNGTYNFTLDATHESTEQIKWSDVAGSNAGKAAAVLQMD